MIVKAIKQEKKFEPVTVQFTLETEEEVAAVAKFFGYNMSMPAAVSVVMKQNGEDGDTVLQQQRIVSQLLGNLHNEIRSAI